ncbi:MAG TPA: YciI family protein [Natronosporangium sp.]|nr:YciI family protein [Natronosporangium sp.]
MKVMVMIKGTGADEATSTPTQMPTEAVKAMLEAMGAYNERLVKAGIMLDGDGLKPSSAGAKVVFEGGTTTVVDGPFTEAKEIVGGYWIWQVSSLEEAIEWAKQCPTDPSGKYQVLEIRPYVDESDFGEAYTEEVREHEARLGEEIRARHGDS